MFRLWMKMMLFMCGGSHDNRPAWRRKLDSFAMHHLPGMMTCAEFDQFLADYTDGLLSEKQDRVFKFHMALCPMCKAHFETYLASYQISKQVFGASEEAVPETVPEELITAILDTNRRATSTK